MKRLFRMVLPVLACVLVPTAVRGAEPGGTRTIRILQDDALETFVSKVFELKYVQPADILPYVNAAVKRYNHRSLVHRVTASGAGKTGALLVTTEPKFMPYAADLIAKLDKPGKADQFGSLIEGTGITRIAYTPKFRAAEDFPNLINSVFGTSEGSAYLDKGTNTVYWKDVNSTALSTLEWIKYLDRPLPQAEIRIHYYEMRESKLRDIGFDYLAWKNGPGVNLFNVGYNAGRITMNEVMKSVLLQGTQLATKFGTSWGYGGFFTAPAFDMSFVRILQQSGSAKVVGHASLMVTGTPVSDAYGIIYGKYVYSTAMMPEYVNIQKTSEGRSYVSYPGATAENYEDHGEVNPEYANPAKASIRIINPVICYAGGTGATVVPGTAPDTKLYAGKDGGVIFNYSSTFGSTVERSGLGEELPNSITVTGSATLGFNSEKILTVYEKESKVKQYIGLPFFHKIPILKYLTGTTTSVKEHTYVIVSAEAHLIDLNDPEVRNRAAREPKVDEKDKWKITEWDLD